MQILIIHLKQLKINQEFNGTLKINTKQNSENYQFLSQIPVIKGSFIIQHKIILNLNKINVCKQLITNFDKKQTINFSQIFLQFTFSPKQKEINHLKILEISIKLNTLFKEQKIIRKRLSQKLGQNSSMILCLKLKKIKQANKPQISSIQKPLLNRKLKEELPLLSQGYFSQIQDSYIFSNRIQQEIYQLKQYQISKNPWMIKSSLLNFSKEKPQKDRETLNKKQIFEISKPNKANLIKPQHFQQKQKYLKYSQPLTSNIDKKIDLKNQIQQLKGKIIKLQKLNFLLQSSLLESQIIIKNLKNDKYYLQINQKVLQENLRTKQAELQKINTKLLNAQKNILLKQQILRNQLNLKVQKIKQLSQINFNNHKQLSRTIEQKNKQQKIFSSEVYSLKQLLIKNSNDPKSENILKKYKSQTQLSIKNQTNKIAIKISTGRIKEDFSIDCQQSFEDNQIKVVQINNSFLTENESIQSFQEFSSSISTIDIIEPQKTVILADILKEKQDKDDLRKTKKKEQIQKEFFQLKIKYQNLKDILLSLKHQLKIVKIESETMKQKMVQRQKQSEEKDKQIENLRERARQQLKSNIISRDNNLKNVIKCK